MSHAVTGDVARVNGQLAVSRAFGDKNLKLHLRSDPDVEYADIKTDTDLLILASDGLWKVISLFISLICNCKSQFLFHVCLLSTIQVMSNQEAVDIARKIKDPHRAAKQLATEALNRESKDDISCIVVRFKS